MTTALRDDSFTHEADQDELDAAASIRKEMEASLLDELHQEIEAEEALSRMERLRSSVDDSYLLDYEESRHDGRDY